MRFVSLNNQVSLHSIQRSCDFIIETLYDAAISECGRYPIQMDTMRVPIPSRKLRHSIARRNILRDDVDSYPGIHAVFDILFSQLQLGP